MAVGKVQQRHIAKGRKIINLGRIRTTGSTGQRQAGSCSKTQQLNKFPPIETHRFTLKTFGSDVSFPDSDW